MIFKCSIFCKNSIFPVLNLEKKKSLFKVSIKEKKQDLGFFGCGGLFFFLILKVIKVGIEAVVTPNSNASPVFDFLVIYWPADLSNV